MKQVWICTALLLVANTACAASFDCDKAGTKVEKMICADAELSKLDDGLGKLYQDVLGKANEKQKKPLITIQRHWLKYVRNICKNGLCLKQAYWSRQAELEAFYKLDKELRKLYQDVLDKANEKQKKRLITEQRHWLKYVRNICKNELCLKQAYWSRQAALDTFFVPINDPFAKESDKAVPIKKILASHVFYESTISDQKFCGQFFKNLKNMKGIKFIEPILKVNSYEDPALDPWKQQCKSSPPFHYGAGCDPNLLRGYKRTGEEGYKNTLLYCEVGYGMPPYKLFELPPKKGGKGKRYIFYSDNSYGPMNQDHKKPAIGRGYAAGFSQIDISSCSHVHGSGFAIDRDPAGHAYNGIIGYKNKFYVVQLHDLFLLPTKNSSQKEWSWWLTVELVSPRLTKGHQFCSWSPVKPLKYSASNQKGK